MSDELQKPTVGRIVHYVSDDAPNGEYELKHRAAIVTEVYKSPMISGLCVLNPTGMVFNRSVIYDDTCSGGTWHWPER